MGSRDKDTKTLQDKLKQYFKKNTNVPGVQKNELLVTGDLERELSAETPQHRRLKTLRDVTEKVTTNRVLPGGIEKLWAVTRDLLEESNMETRHTALNFLRCLVEGQADQLVMMRTVFLRWLQTTHAEHRPEDSQLRFQVLRALTNSGKNITCFEEEIGPFLLEWLPQIQNPIHIVEFLELVTNVVKYNAAYLEEVVVTGIVNNCCMLCCHSPESNVVQCSLSVLLAVVSYSIFPQDALHSFVCALCRTVNLECYCQNSWKLMRHVLGAALGHAALGELLDVLGGGGGADAGLARGAVFYINMALWGGRRVATLSVSYLAVLPAFLMALEAGPQHQVLTYEVLLAVQSLLQRNHRDLHDVAYDIVFQILNEILNHIEGYDPPNELIGSRFHDVITLLEQMVERRQYFGSLDQLYDLIDRCGHSRPEASVARLLRHKLAAAETEAAGAWLSAERYASRSTERRASVRLLALQAVHDWLRAGRGRRERPGEGRADDELAERLALPAFTAAALDPEPPMRCAAARALAEMAAHAASEACADLLDLVERILNRPFEMYVTDFSLTPETDMSDIYAALRGLLDLFHVKLFRQPIGHAIRVYFILLGHLEQHYTRPTLFLHHPDVRLKILELFFSVRINGHYQVGFCYDANGQPVGGELALQQRLRPTFSPYLSIVPKKSDKESSEKSSSGGAAAPDKEPRRARAGAEPGRPQAVAAVAATRASRLVPRVLTAERDWPVLAATLRALPRLLQHRPLLGRSADIDLLAATLCAMVSDRSLCLPERLQSAAGARPSLSEFHAAVLPVLASLAPYHACLEPQTQQRIIRCLLKYGIVLRTPAPCIAALTLFTLETRDTMVKMLPEVLLDLSKISDTAIIACPMLEFLSTLTRLPKVFASFVEDQYMSVFAILLPYTNPSRYNHYVVSLAHHVIAAWFLKCRLKYRRNFVKFIIHGLHNYIIVPFEEQLLRAPHVGTINEDSSNRKRSSSLGSRGVSRASPLSSGRGAGGAGAAGGGAGAAGGVAAGASASAAFHLELTETCVDLLARYTFTPCTVKPQRSPTVEFLLGGGQSQTWLVGHKLVTITTSGCLQNSLRQGLCDRCAVLCKQHTDSLLSPYPESTENQNPEIKRYSKWSLQHSRSTETSCSSLSISDNSLLPPAAHPTSGLSTRQNSAENKSAAGEACGDAQAQLTSKLESLSTQEGAGGGGGGGAAWSRVGALAGGGCPCWCAGWAEVHVRGPTGDISWVMRMQNQMNFDRLLESPLHDVAALLAPSLAPAAAPAPAASPPSSGLGDSRQDVTSESEPRSRSASASAAERAPPHLHKSSSDSTVAQGPPPARAPPPRAHVTTEPINIPASPQRQSSSSTTDDDDTLIPLHDRKSRHPVRRSNSSPEMSSSWKAVLARGAAPAAPEPEPDGLQLHFEDMILLPSCEPQTSAASLHASKKAHKKNELRVSCEAIPEEAAHPALMTYNSDPGTGQAVSSDTALDALGERNTHHALQKVASDGSVSAARARGPAPCPAPGPAPGAAPASPHEELPPLARSKRSNTISVMSPTRRKRVERPVVPRETVSPKDQRLAGGGVSPGFVLLQLYHNIGAAAQPIPGVVGSMVNSWAERPLLVAGAQHERSVKNLDLVPPLETYKVGVLYVGPGQQDNEVLILKNEYGSVRYAEFVRELGTLVDLETEPDPALFLNLEKGGKDGLYTYVWNDDIMQVHFHVATAMPCSERDPNCNEKRKYIGNDFVSIVYNDSGCDFNIHTIKGQLNFCIVVVEPLEHGVNRVLVKSKDERVRTKFLAHLHPHLVSDQNVALLARQLALHCTLASLISRSLGAGTTTGAGAAPYASNSLERLRIIKRLRARLEAERHDARGRAEPYAAPARRRRDSRAMDDFTEYT